MHLRIKEQEFEVDYIDAIDIHRVPPKISLRLVNYAGKIIMLEWLKAGVTVFFTQCGKQISWTGISYNKNGLTDFQISLKAKNVLCLIAVVFIKIKQKQGLKIAEFIYGGPKPERKKPKLEYQDVISFYTLKELVLFARQPELDPTPATIKPKISRTKTVKKRNENQMELFAPGETYLDG